MSLPKGRIAWFTSLLLAASVSANAGPVLSVEAFNGTAATGTPIGLTVNTDSSAGTLVAFNSNYTLSIQGQGAPNISGLALGTLNASSATANGVLTIVLNQSGLTATQAAEPFGVSFTGNMLSANSSATINFADYVTAGITPFNIAATNLLASTTFAATSSVASTASMAVAKGLTVGGLYSQTEVIQINFNTSGSISASSQIISAAAVPEPASVLLLTTGLLAARLAARRTRGV